MSQIELRNVIKTYESGEGKLNAVDNLSLSVDPGEFLSIVGHSGSGKTTLLSLIGGIIHPTSGTVFFEGKNLGAMGSDGLSQYRSEKIGFMFQFASLLPMLTAHENLLLPTAFTKNERARSRAKERAADLLGRVGLKDKMGSYPGQLSGGQQRRVAIARRKLLQPSRVAEGRGEVASRKPGGHGGDGEAVRFDCLPG